MTGILKKTLSAVLALSTVACITAATANAGWVMDSANSSYQYTDENGVSAVNCWKYINGNWYRFDENGTMVTGWYSENGINYYLRPNGSMSRSWTEIDGEWYAFDSSGAPRSGWWYYQDNWYYFDTNGKMLSSQWIENTYYLTETGETARGFLTVDGVLRYFRVNGAMSKSWVYENDTWYRFDENGELMTGWIVDQDERYFANSDGEIQTGIIQIDGINYQFDEDGLLTASGVTGTPSAAYASDGSKEIVATGEKVSLTMYANYNVNYWGSLLEKYNVCTQADFLEAVNREHPFKYNDQIPDGMLYRYEGYLYPTKYTFYTGQSADAVVEMMLMQFEENVGDDMVAQFNAMGYSLHEAVTFASILQAEGGSSEYRYGISAVFQNRLASPDYPKLQSNPTRTYAQNYIADNPQLAATYDTYQCKGLPAGPINNPGSVAFDALLNPDPDCDAFYFCSDMNGKVYYASTLEEHNANREIVEAVNAEVEAEKESKASESSDTES